MIQTQSVTDLMNSNLEEVNSLVISNSDSPGLRIIEMDISGDFALLRQVSVGQSSSNSVTLIIVNGRMKPAG